MGEFRGVFEAVSLERADDGLGGVGVDDLQGLDLLPVDSAAFDVAEEAVEVERTGDGLELRLRVRPAVAPRGGSGAGTPPRA